MAGSMPMSTHFATTLLVCATLNLFVQLATAQVSQQGFVSIDCGANQSYNDPLTTIQWQTDESFITVGYNAPVQAPAGNNLTNLFSEVTTIRVFNETALPKYCYSLPVTDNNTYSLRATFFYGESNASGLDPPSFQLALDATVVANVSTDRDLAYYFEYTFLAHGNNTFLCLLRDATLANPFISAISLRPAVMYPRFAGYLADLFYIRTRARFNFGGTSRVRFPIDVHDRYWSPVGPNSTYLQSNTTPIETLSTTHPIDLSLYGGLVPEVVLQTAVTAQGNMTIKGLDIDSSNSYLVLHFVELNNHTSNVSRKFMVKVPNVIRDSYENPYNFSQEAFKPMYWAFWNVIFNSSSDIITFYPKPRSRLGPLVNALELYSFVKLAANTTDPQDALGIELIKEGMNLTEWTGDPCLPVPHSWITCNPPDTFLQPRVDQLNLSGYNLHGTIPAADFSLLEASSLFLDNNAFTGTFPNLSSMSNLQHLDLQNNQLSGPLPDWLATMSTLEELSIQNNNFSGIIPAPLLARKSFNFTYRPGNPYLLITPNSTVTSTGTKHVLHAAAYIFITVLVLYM